MSEPGSSFPLSVAISTALYRLLLAFYPAGFREKYSGPMAQLFRDCCGRAYANTGLLGVVGFWWRTIFDWASSLITEWSRKETEMTQGKFIRLSGWAMILGGFSMGIGLFVQLDWIRLMLYRTLGPPTTIEEYNHYWALAENLGELPNLAGLLLVVVGICGLRLHYRNIVGRYGRTLLDISLVGGLISVVALVLLAGSGNAWWLFVSGFAVMFSSLALFGLVAGKKGILQPLQAGFLLSGFWFPVSIVLSLLLEYFNDGQWIEIPGWIEMPIWTAVIIALMLLGQELQAEARQKEITA